MKTIRAQHVTFFIAAKLRAPALNSTLASYLRRGIVRALFPA